MKNKIFFLAFVLVAVVKVNAQYASFIIPAALKENADVVVRLEEKEVSIKSKGNASIRHHYIYTILTPAGDKYSDFVKHYDKLIKVSDVEGRLYDGMGIKLKSVKKSEIKDYSNTDESNLADDDRVKYHDFNHNFYPYTIEYEYVIEFEGIFQFPRWIPVFGENVAVEKSILKVSAPADYQLRYKSFNYKEEPIVNAAKNNKEYTWQLSNYNAHKREVYSPWWHEVTPSVFLAPSSFVMQRYEGTMNSWQEFGSFMYKLNAGRDQLPEHIKLKVHQLTDGITDRRKKIEILYRYLQQNTRYISIQLGIGGWQTLDANFVATNGYGDCKALTNYMCALLKEAGIASYYTLIKSGAGEQMLLNDFSSNQFDHVILCVPQAKDTVWLECTSQRVQPGYMGSFTGNRQALIIDAKNSQLVWTPDYKATDNLQARHINGTVSSEGVLSATVETGYSATQQDELDHILEMYSKQQLSQYMHTKFKLSSYQVENFSHEKTKGILPAIKEKISLKVNDFASVTGKRMFINPNVLTVSSFKIKGAETRKFDFEMLSSFTDTDTVSITIPAGYKPESMPKDNDIKLPNAQYRSTFKVENEHIIYTRYFSQQAATIPAAKAAELAEFFEKIYKADRSKVVFVKEVQ